MTLEIGSHLYWLGVFVVFAVLVERWWWYRVMGRR